MGLVFFGLFFGGIPFLMWRKHVKFFKKAILVPGVVIDAIPNQSERTVISYKGKAYTRRGRNTTYTPLVQYEFEGETREVQGNTYSSGLPKMGKQMMVGINPDDSRDVRLKESTWLFFLFMIIGLVAFVSGFVSLLKNVLG
jgi:hypothetical protein